MSASKDFDKLVSRGIYTFSWVLNPLYSKDKYIEIDISSINSSMKDVLFDPYKMERYIQDFLDKSSKKIAFGGYLEKRNLYEQSQLFTSEEKRDVHLGVDFWCDSGTSVHAVYDGKIHSVAHNLKRGDYGPTIILEHTISSFKWYSLYGHLSVDSLYHKVGDVVTTGQPIGFLGDASVNGYYAPHLHFQIILDIQNYKGDYPGVCSEATLNYYKNNSPNPLNLFPL